MTKKETKAQITLLAADIAKIAGVDAAAAEKVLRALNVESQISQVAGLTKGKINPSNVKLAYRISTGGMIA